MHSRVASGFNNGIFELKRAIRNGLDKDAKTLIVSGLPRSGTSMVARALCEASIFLGDGIDDVVYEDHEISSCLNLQDLITLQRAIRSRNSRFRTWGFKKPNIHDFINPKRESFFRNPHYIFTFRDPIAIARRNIVSELFDEATSLAEVVSMQGLMAKFVLDLPCPVLLLSYEKAIQSPLQCVESLVEFAELHIDETRKQKMVDSIEPNRREYLAKARRAFQGSLDGIQDDVLFGWCREVSLVEPIAISLFINEARMATIVADTYREDLASAGIGLGQHAFCIDLRRFDPKPTDVIRIFAQGRSFELINSGKTAQELRF